MTFSRAERQRNRYGRGDQYQTWYKDALCCFELGPRGCHHDSSGRCQGRGRPRPGTRPSSQHAHSWRSQVESGVYEISAIECWVVRGCGPRLKSMIPTHKPEGAIFYSEPELAGRLLSDCLAFTAPCGLAPDALQTIQCPSSSRPCISRNLLRTYQRRVGSSSGFQGSSNMAGEK